jgi:hypothetical protein
VQGDVPGQAIEGLDQVEEPVEPAPCGKATQAGAAQLGQVGQRGPGIPGPDVRESLGEGVDLPRRQPERRADSTSTSMSGSAWRSGERNRSMSSPCRIGSTPEMPSR